MIRIDSRECFDGVITTIRCYHGWKDHKGHVLFTDLCDVPGEDNEQILVATYDAINRLLKDRTRDWCKMPQGAGNLS